MQIGNSRPLRVLGLIASGDEGQWHRRFEHDRIGGEWFQRSPDLVSAIDSARTHILRVHIRDGQTTRADRIVVAPTRPEQGGSKP